MTYRPAFTGGNALRLLYAAAKSSPEDPRAKAPDRDIPDEIAEICLKSLSRNPVDRYASALGFAEAVEAFLEGSRRKEAAARHVAAADQAWGRYRRLQSETESLQEKARVIADSVPTWASLQEKASLLETRDRLEALGQERADLFEEVISSCEQALSQDPDNPGACSLLAQVHYARFEEAEIAGDTDVMRGAERRVLRYDDGSFGPLIKGVGALTLRTDPPGTEVLCRNVHREGLVWTLGEPRTLGRTPLIRIPLDKGSYVLTLKRPGKRDSTYPVLIARGQHWDSGPTPIPLFSDSEIGEEFVYVPAGKFVAGGDLTAPGASESSEPWVDGFFIGRCPVTMAQYREFLDGLHRIDPDDAWLRVPRFDKGSPYWDQPEPDKSYVIPAVDRDGDEWHPDYPVFGISWDDAAAYAEWRSTREKKTHLLPSEHQWEKAARGVDGRIFPWGDRFDPSLCKMNASRDGASQIEPIRRFPTDRSVYGAEDLAGTMREWCRNLGPDAADDRLPVRGGSWHSSEGTSRLASRSTNQRWVVYTSIGFRLARPLPSSTTGW